YEQGGVAAAGVDLVDVERAWRPSGQRPADGLRGERRGPEQAGEQAARDAFAMEWEGYSRTQPGRAPPTRASSASDLSASRARAASARALRRSTLRVMGQDGRSAPA